jgi:hypothetical protein
MVNMLKVTKVVKRHTHKVDVPFVVSHNNSIVSDTVTLIIDDDRDEFIASHVPAYCPKKDDSIAVLKLKLLGSVTDFVEDVSNIAKLLEKHGIVPASDDELDKFVGDVTGELLDRTQNDSDVVNIKKTIKCVHA